MSDREWRISEEPAVAFIQRAICMCGGEMVATGQWVLSMPPQMPHKCASCGKTVTLSGNYPTVVHRPAPSRQKEDAHV